MENLGEKTEEFLPLAQKIKRLVDSIQPIEDSLARVALIKAADSAAAAQEN